MEKIFLVFVFAFSLFLKMTNAAGADEVSANVSEIEPVAGSSNSVNADSAPPSVPQSAVEAPASPFSSPQNSPPQNSLMLADGEPTHDAGSVLGTSQRDSGEPAVSIIPLLGTTAYNGAWYDHVRNSYTFGLILEIPTTRRFSVEVEGMYAKSNVSYAFYSHDFSQYSIGGNGKFYLSRGVVQPYLGLGATALRYQNMSYGPLHPQGRYSQWIGAGQVIAGADVEVARNAAVGIRGQWVVPVLNRPSVGSYGSYAYPYYEEASLMNTTFFRVMGSVRLTF